MPSGASRSQFFEEKMRIEQEHCVKLEDDEASCCVYYSGESER
jgi:hypothetical protein